MKYLVQIAFYTIIIAALVVINLNQLSLTRAGQAAPISGPITSPVVTPQPSQPSQPSTNHDNGGSSHSGGNSGPSVCGDPKPGTPVLLSVVKTGPNQVKLTWSKPVGPVSSYVLTYGLTPTKMLYGNPNVGNTTSFVVNQLRAGTTYYFQVSAANGCTPGAFSNTLGVNASGKVLGSTAATGFKAKLTNTTAQPKQIINKAKPSSTPAKTNEPVVQKASEVKAPSFIDNFVYKAIRFFYR